MSHTKDKWVIVFLIYADFRENVKDFGSEAFSMTEQMKAELNSMFKDILSTPVDSSRTRMYVIMNRIDYRKEGSAQTEAKTLVYKIDNPENHLKYNQITYCHVIKNETGNPDKPNPRNPVQRSQILKNILKEEVIVNEDEEVFFITWDHGSVFGIFREIDPGLAKVRKPIYHDLKHYPYLEEFWNKAIKEDPEINELVDQANRKKQKEIIQIGYKLYRMETVPVREDFSEKFSYMTQSKINVNRRIDVSNESNFFLLYDKEFVVSNDSTLIELIDSKKIIAKLTDVGVREILSNEELDNVFQGWLGADKKVGVLLMMNCWMMNLHTMYSFVNTVNFLVAPQSNIGTPGYNYKAILYYLFKKRYFIVSSQKLAVKCVKTVDTKRMSRKSVKLREDGRDVIDTWKIFAVDLQRKIGKKSILMNHLNRLNQIIIGLNPAIQKKTDEATQLYKAMRLVSFDFTKEGSFGEEYFVVDIINWLAILFDLRRRNPIGHSFPIDFTTLACAGRLIDDIHSGFNTKQLVLSTSYGKNVYETTTAVVGFPPTGYSLFFPNSISTNQNLIDNVRNDSLLNKRLLEWREFIKSIYPEDIWKPFFG